VLRGGYTLILCSESQLSIQFATLRSPRNCGVHFATSALRKYTSFLNTTMHVLVLHAHHQRILKILIGNWSPLSIQPRIYPFRPSPVWALKRWHEGQQYEDDEAVHQCSHLN
jgi:hypothetical protein